MAIYAAYLKPEESAGDPEGGFRLVRDGNSPWALVFPPFWLAWHRLWVPLLAYFVVTMAIILLAVWQPGAPIAYLSALPGLYLLLEGSELIRGKLERQGWRYSGIVQGDTNEEAEIRFLAGREDILAKPRQSSISSQAVARPAFQSPTTSAGLFPE